MELSTADAGEPELFGTETMAELCARQGRLNEAVRIYQRLLENNPPADKIARWTERARSLERARAYAPDLATAPITTPLTPPVPTPIAVSMPLPSRREVEPPTPVVEVISDGPLAGTLVADAAAQLASNLATAPGGATSAATPAPQRPPPLPPSTRTAVAARPAGPAPEEPHRLPLVITQPVRSGQVFYARKNDLIVLGSVNPGGQVVADGNIHIYGALRGRAIAGAQGAAEARIFCQKLEAELLAISGIYLVWDDIPRNHLGKPVQIALRGDACVISPL